MTETEATAVAETPKNPFSVTLLTVAIVALVIAAGLGVLSFSTYSSEESASRLIWAGLFTNLAFSSGLLWLVVEAINWKAKN